MTRRQLAALAVAAVIVSAGGFAAGARLAANPVENIGPGAMAPDIAATTLDADPVLRHIADFRGRVVLLNLWATWCGPCEVEMPSIEALHRKLGPRGLTVVAVSVDDPGNEDRIRSFVRDHGLTFEILNEGSGRIEARYQSRGIPTTVLIDRDGVIREKVIGAADWNDPERRRRVEELLAR